MRRKLKNVACVSFCLMMLVILLIPHTARADDALYFAKPPAYDIVPLGPSLLRLDQKAILLDLSDDQFLNKNPLAQVTASYHLTNRSFGNQSIKIAFPYITSPMGESLSTLRILADDAAVPFEITLDRDLISSDYYENQSAFQDTVSLSSLLAKITQAPFVFEPYGKNRGVFYSISATPTTEDPNIATSENPMVTNAITPSEAIPSSSPTENQPQVLDVTVTFDVLSEDTAIITSGYQSMTCRENTHYTLLTQVKDDALDSLGIIVMGAGISNFSVSVESTDHSDLAWNASYQVDYIALRDFINSNISLLVENLVLPELSTLSQENLYSIVASDLKDKLSQDRLSFLENSLQSLYADRLTICVFELPFASFTSKNLTISYSMQGTADQTNSSAPVYRFAYLLDVSEGWQTEGNMSIEILTSKSSPYITQSSLSLTRQGNRYYTSRPASPRNDLTFSTYSQSEVDYLTKINPMEDYLPYFIAGGVTFVLVCMGTFILFRRHRKKALKKDE